MHARPLVCAQTPTRDGVRCNANHPPVQSHCPVGTRLTHRPCQQTKPPRISQRGAQKLSLGCRSSDGHRLKGIVSASREGSTGSNVTLRNGSPADLPTIRKAVMRERMNPLGLDVERFVVAEGSRGEIQGFGQLASLGSTDPSGKQPLELKSLIVEPAHRNSGVGKMLLRELVARGHDSEIFLTTLASTEPFYKVLLFEYYAGIVVARLAAQQRLIVMRRAPDTE